MIINEKESRNDYVLGVARAMMAAARTAPKARGIDKLEIVTLRGKQLALVAEQMRLYGECIGLRFFLRDAGNVEQAEAAVIIGTTYDVFGLDCGFCGFPTCAAKSEHEAIPCVFNTNDMGIAIGSAASIAADYRIDNRVMYSVGRAAIDMGLMGECRAAMGILLSCSGKSPFFDRVFE